MCILSLRELDNNNSKNKRDWQSLFLVDELKLLKLEEKVGKCFILLVVGWFNSGLAVAISQLAKQAHLARALNVCFVFHKS